MRIIRRPGPQCASGVGLAGRFLIVSVISKRDSSEAFLEIVSWWKSDVGTGRNIFVSIPLLSARRDTDVYGSGVGISSMIANWKSKTRAGWSQEMDGRNVKERKGTRFVKLTFMECKKGNILKFKTNP